MTSLRDPLGNPVKLHPPPFRLPFVRVLLIGLINFDLFPYIYIRQTHRKEGFGRPDK